MPRIRRKSLPALLLALGLAPVLAGCRHHDEPVLKARFDAQGNAALPAAVVPPSSYLSPEARRAYLEKVGAVAAPDRAPLLERIEDQFPVVIERGVLAGVPVAYVTPRAPVPIGNAGRILISLHGGSYEPGSGGEGRLVEAIPVAVMARMTVVSVDYRLSPGAHFPDATEDVAAVYRELLKTHEASAIGLYGCSTGAALAASAVVWIHKLGLPRPGALGLFCEGAIQDDRFEGDSWYVGSALTGGPIPGPKEPPPLNDYMRGTDPRDPAVAPVDSPQALALFPPTLLITGTRDFMMSGVLHTHAELVKAGVEAELHVWDGLWHAFITDTDLPETHDALVVVGRFFDRHLAGPRRGRGAAPP